MQTKPDINSDKGSCCTDSSHGNGPLKGVSGTRAELVLAVLAGILLFFAWLFDTWIGSAGPVGADSPLWRTFVNCLYGASILCGGVLAASDAIGDLLAFRFRIESLMLLAAAGAVALGHPCEGALLLFLFALGHALEHMAMGRARRSIAALAKLRPEAAMVIRENQPTEVPIEQIQIGEIVLVRPDERIATDGIVIHGTSSVDQSPVTGESIPVDKTAAPAELTDRWNAVTPAERIADEHQVYAGTINGPGALQIRTTCEADNSTIDRVMQLVLDSQGKRSPTEQFAAKIERFYVPAILILSILLLFAFLVVNESFAESFYRSMAVLVGASPCALAIATPSAVLSAIARGGQRGVLIKGGGPLETLAQVRIAAFDKTGTLTRGKPELTDIFPQSGTSEEELLGLVVAVERLSQHPLARAIVRDALRRYPHLVVPPAGNVERFVGLGIAANVETQRIAVGRVGWSEGSSAEVFSTTENADVARLVAQGRSVIGVYRDTHLIGLLGLMDIPREDAKSTLERLRRSGIRQLVLLSGDAPHVAVAVGNEVGIDQSYGGLLPEDKSDKMSEMVADAPTLMVGDGVNDAPAMATASVAVAMGAAGSEAALETADIALMADSLDALPVAMQLSQRASQIIRQNLILSLGTIVFLVPAAILGLRLGPAVVLHEGSTLLVVLNALRLLRFEADR